MRENNSGNENIDSSMFGMTYVTGRKDKLMAACVKRLSFKSEKYCSAKNRGNKLIL